MSHSFLFTIIVVMKMKKLWKSQHMPLSPYFVIRVWWDWDLRWWNIRKFCLASKYRVYNAGMQMAIRFPTITSDLRSLITLPTCRSTSISKYFSVINLSTIFHRIRKFPKIFRFYVCVWLPVLMLLRSISILTSNPTS